jgi:hypothetical protein
MLEIDRLEDELAPLAQDVSRVRDLVSSLELCHHKAERWVHNIIEAIGVERTNKGLGTRRPGQFHAAEKVWQGACDILSAWCAGATVPGAPLLNGLGDRSALKEWQVQRIVDRVRSLVHWPSHEPETQYVYILFGGGQGESFYRAECPEAYREREDFWLATVRTMIHDTLDGSDAELSLGLAIDMLWPCHWRFAENLQIVLDAIGGRLEPGKPFAACARNIALLPNRARMLSISRALRAFSGRAEPRESEDVGILSQLGKSTPAKRWLAASLDKTIRLQLDPPAEVRSISALNGPDWIMRA